MNDRIETVRSAITYFGDGYTILDNEIIEIKYFPVIKYNEEKINPIKLQVIFEDDFVQFKIIECVKNKKIEGKYIDISNIGSPYCVVDKNIKNYKFIKKKIIVLDDYDDDEEKKKISKKLVYSHTRPIERDRFRGERAPGEVIGEIVPGEVIGEIVPGEVMGEIVPGEVMGEIVPGEVMGEIAPGEVMGELVPGEVMGEIVPGEVMGEIVPGEVTDERVGGSTIPLLKNKTCNTTSFILFFLIYIINIITYGLILFLEQIPKNI